MRDEYEPVPEPRGSLVPPPRYPPTAVGAATPEPEPRPFRSFGHGRRRRGAAEETVLLAGTLAAAMVRDAAKLVRFLARGHRR